jgi:hypothetical protein
MPCHHGKRGALLERGRDKIMAVMGIALDGEESLAGRHRAAVDGNARDGLRQRPDAVRARRGRNRLNRPQRHRHGCTPAARAFRTAS